MKMCCLCHLNYIILFFLLFLLVNIAPSTLVMQEHNHDKFDGKQTERAGFLMVL